MSDLYEPCPSCPPRSMRLHCERCHGLRLIKVGITKDDVTRLHDHLGRDAAIMAELRAEVTRLEGLLKEALDRLARSNADTRTLLESSGRLNLRLDEAKELLREAKDLNAEYTVRLEAVGRVMGEWAVRLGMDPVRLAALIEAKLPEVRAEFRDKADAGRN